MCRVRLIHWNAAEAEERAARLQADGYEVEHDVPDGAAGLRGLWADPPDAIVIDLGRLPSQGRDLALAVRARAATRHVPLVLVAGDPEKVARIRELLPDAAYTAWDDIRGTLEQAIAHPPAAPVVPESVFGAYAGTPLPKKLGIKAGSVVALVGSPEGFEETLGELPDRVVLHRRARRGCDVTLWFTTSRAQLERGIERMGASASDGVLWVLWPKRASGVATDLSLTAVRKVGLAAGLVDYKISAIDATWSGLRFTRRRPA